ncbi:MAG: hypothetical protein GX585_00360, partial [Clostridiales bacterium]|nr:hypothetical protein [Clostridiales bacterium]
SSVTYGAWLADGARVAGEYGVVPSGTNGCYVVQFLRRARAEDSHQTADTRQILLTVEAEAPAVDTEENGEAEAAPPTEAQLNAIYEKAEALLGEWKLGAASAEAFAALAETHSADGATAANGGLTTGVARGTSGAELDEWLFTPGRQAGDTAIVEETDSDGAVVGYRIVYLEALGPVRWKHAADEALAGEEYSAWYSDTLFHYELKRVEKGMNMIGD